MSPARRISKTGLEGANQLRKRAEEILRKRVGEVEPAKLSAEDARRLVLELQVHQIELEMQNEELRTAQVELEESWRNYIDLYDFAPVGYFTFDKDGVILEANLTGASLLGVERAILIKKPFAIYVERGYQDLFYFHRERVFKSGERQACELKLKRKDGSEFYAQLESVPMKDTDICRSSMSDITERKRVQEERERLIAELKEVLANLKVLKGLLPICAWCGKIRDDKGYWSRVEAYFEAHSELKFTHGMCDQCMIKWKKGDMEDRF